MKISRLALIAVVVALTACAEQPATAPNPAIMDPEQRAFAETSTLAAAGQVAAERELGLRYMTGRGVAPDPAKAVEWLSKAAAAGDASAETGLAYAYENGTGVARDSPRAQALLLQAAEQGFVMAESAVGYRFMQGIGTPVDYPQALTWLKHAADAGDVSATVNLAYMFGEGLGMPKDEATAIGWYKQAAELGSRDAQLFLANLYLNGYPGVVPQDYALAQQYFQEASEGTMRSYAEMAEVMKAIVAAHKTYPREALAAKQGGTVTVEFDCPERQPRQVKVTQSSGFPLLDDTARQAVADSYFPDRSPELKGMKHFKIAVAFAPGAAATPAPGVATKAGPAH